MAPHISCQTILIPAICSGLTEQGFLVFADDQLMAMVIYHQDSVREDMRGLWYLETGYGPCAEGPRVDRVFQSPDEAQQWVRERVARVSPAPAQHSVVAFRNSDYVNVWSPSRG